MGDSGYRQEPIQQPYTGEVPNQAAFPNQPIQTKTEKPSVVGQLIDEAREAMGDWLFLGIFLAGILSLWGGQLSLKRFQRAKRAWQNESSGNIRVKRDD
jgi:hypothetical protein